GGTGKTDLGLAAARQALPHFLNGVVFVSLEAVDKAADLPATLLQTLVSANFIPPPAPGQEPESYLFDQLREREMLLIFDNYEQLLPQTGFLQRLLDSAPRLKLLVTSRERLRLRQEQLFQISGLSDIADAQRLFLMRAQPALPPEDEVLVQEICRLVDNLPLAIELAAGWAHVQKLSEIVTELQQGLDILVARFRDQEPRHVSMEAVFEQSWQRLNEDERQFLRHLPAFQAPFTAESALIVSSATRRELASLLDKALVRRQGDRFQLHPLLQQFVLAKWTLAVEREVRDRHLAFFMGFIAKYQSGLADYPEAKVMDIVAEVLPDIIMAWKWACRSQREDAFNQMQLALRSYFSMRGPLQTGVELFQTAAKCFPIETDIGLNLRLSTAYLLQKLGRHKSAQEAIAELLPHEEKLSASDAGLAHHIMAVCLYMTGVYGEARAHSERVLAYGVAVNDMGLESLAYGLLGVIALAGIDFDDQGVFQAHNWRPELLDVAIERFEQSLKMARQVNEVSRIVTNLHNLGYCRWRALDFPAASALFQQAIHIAEQAGSNGSQTR
ncbi:MAG: hypothetical protein KDD89_13120, partial [Anaerolineales bacterium]|nr:hypothetical protein [Anaerolineales bacterium]